MGWTDSIKDTIWEHEDKPAGTEITAATAVPAVVSAMAPMSDAPIGGHSVTSTSDTDPLYQRLFTQTDPSKLPDLNKLYTLAKPLEEIIIDPALRMRAAFAQSGVTSAIAVANVNALLARLKTETDQFSIDKGKFKTAIDTDKATAKKLESQLQELRAKITSDETTLRSKEESFIRACDRRRGELEDLKQQFSKL